MNRGKRVAGGVPNERAEALDPRRSRTAPFHGDVLRQAPPARLICASRAGCLSGIAERLRDPYGSTPPFGSCEGRAPARPEQHRAKGYWFYQVTGAAPIGRETSEGCSGLAREGIDWGTGRGGRIQPSKRPAGALRASATIGAGGVPPVPPLMPP